MSEPLRVSLPWQHWCHCLPQLAWTHLHTLSVWWLVLSQAPQSLWHHFSSQLFCNIFNKKIKSQKSKKNTKKNKKTKKNYKKKKILQTQISFLCGAAAYFPFVRCLFRRFKSIPFVVAAVVIIIFFFFHHHHHHHHLTHYNHKLILP